MANLVDATYFIGEINIAQLGQKSVQDKLTVFINKYEPQLLTDVLGYAFYKSFKTAIDGDNPESKWIDLRDGAEFDDCNGIAKKWTGFKNTEKQSPIANLVYYWWQRDAVTATAGMGEIIPQGENSGRTSPYEKMRRAWNEMVDQICLLREFLTAKKDVYMDFDILKTKCVEKIGYF